MFYQLQENTSIHIDMSLILADRIHMSCRKSKKFRKETEGVNKWNKEIVKIILKGKHESRKEKLT